MRDLISHRITDRARLRLAEDARLRKMRRFDRRSPGTVPTAVEEVPYPAYGSAPRFPAARYEQEEGESDCASASPSHLPGRHIGMRAGGWLWRAVALRGGRRFCRAGARARWCGACTLPPVSLFRVNVIAKNMQNESRATDPIEALVDTRSKLSWLPASALSAVGITPRRKRSFVTATGQTVTRDIGYAILASEGYETPTKSSSGSLETWSD